MDVLESMFETSKSIVMFGRHVIEGTSDWREMRRGRQIDRPGDERLHQGYAGLYQGYARLYQGYEFCRGWKRCVEDGRLIYHPGDEELYQGYEG